jgi:hypothetical protein
VIHRLRNQRTGTAFGLVVAVALAIGASLYLSAHDQEPYDPCAPMTGEDLAACHAMLPRD